MRRARPRRRQAAGLVAVAVGVMLATGCSDLQFREDTRLSFLAPRDRADVTLPLTLRWEMRGFTPTGFDGGTDRGRGVFGVFVDRAPIKAGQDLKAVAGDDTSCQRAPSCPDAGYLAARGVYVTPESSLMLDQLSRVRQSGPDRHTATVVLLDGTGRRIGESAWQVDFTVTVTGMAPGGAAGP